MSSEIYFFDLPVYRLQEEKYNRDMEIHIDKVLFPSELPEVHESREIDRLNPRTNNAFRAHLAKQYGGGWMFNEIIGYIRLFFIGTQVRGEYFSISQKRICKTRHKIFKQKSLKLVPDLEIRNTASNKEIF